MDDYHFVSPEDDHSNALSRSSRVGSFTKKFLPVLAVAAVLPVFLFFLYNPPSVTFSTQASEKPELRVWFEPSSLVVTSGNTYDVKVYASLDNKDGFVITSTSFEIETTSGLDADKDSYRFDTPFADEQELGSIIIRPMVSGEQTLSIDESTLFFEPKSPDIKVKPSTLQVYVK